MKGIHLNRVDISGPWRPGTVGISLYGEAKQGIGKELRSRQVKSQLAYTAITVRYMRYIDTACSEIDTAIWRMMSAK
jgi:hypothetical protein